MTRPDPAEREPTPGPAPAVAVTIRCREHGPLVIELPTAGVGLRVIDYLGQAFPLPTGKRAVALCRCGHAKTRPFCDGSHRDCGFSAADVAPAAD